MENVVTVGTEPATQQIAKTVAVITVLIPIWLIILI